VFLAFVFRLLSSDYNLLQRYKKNITYAIPTTKKFFFVEKIWLCQKKVVPLHPELRILKQIYSFHYEKRSIYTISALRFQPDNGAGGAG
jgi:hypothetical protein